MSSVVMVVDDDDKILTLMGTAFGREGFQVICASSAEEALVILEASSISMIFTDLNMPGMDGIQLAVRAKHVHPSLPIIVWTADMTDDVATRAEQAGVLAVFRKPFLFPAVTNLAKKLSQT